MKLIFSGIKNGTIFEPEFQTLTPENGTIEFKPNIIEGDEDKKKWVIADCNGKSKITERIIGLDYHTIVANTDTIQIERHDDAIGILKKYHSLDACVVCDNRDFHGDALLARKQDNRKRIYDGLDQKTDSGA